MSLHYRTQGFILAKKDRGEADRLVSIFTKDFGMLKLWAVSERKITSKLREGLNLFSLSEIEFVEGRNRLLLTDARTIDGYWNLRKDLRKLRAGFIISKLLQKFLVAPECDKRIWELLHQTFSTLNKTPLPNDSSQDSRVQPLEQKQEESKLVAEFYIRLISILGYKK